VGLDFLTKEQVDKFHEDGYVIVDFNIEPELIDTIVREIYPYYDPDFLANPTFPTRLQDYWRNVDAVRKLALLDNIQVALEQLFGRKPLPFQTLNFPIGTTQLPHSDTIHFNSNPPGYMAGVWVALENITEENGPLIYYKKSHLEREYNMQDLGLEIGAENYNAYELAIQALIKERNFEPVLGLMKKGEAVLWHANLLHGGSQQNDVSLSRHSQVTHYYFENCEYYSPIRSTSEKKEIRNPEWITFQPVSALKRIYNAINLYRLFRKR
jgi:ectoine hydroxylase-related dioxygenase (phytanoyl-CoA dioxygenase family)